MASRLPRVLAVYQLRPLAFMPWPQVTGSLNRRSKQDLFLGSVIMTLLKFALRYNSCKIDELRRFFKDRTGKDSNINSGKKVLVSALKKLDEKATFRFLDLPAEMRNKVYRSLVIYNVDAERKVYRAILRTSKEIYKEAKYILMTESMIPLNTKFEKSWKAVYSRNFFGGLQGYRSALSASCQGAINFRFADALGDFAPFFAAQLQPHVRASSIRLRLHLAQGTRPWYFRISDGETDQWVGELATSFLETLFSTCRHLKHLKLTITTDLHGHDAADERQALVRMLRPVGELPSADMTLDLQGLPDATYDEFWRIADSSSAQESDTVEENQEASESSIDGQGTWEKAMCLALIKDRCREEAQFGPFTFPALTGCTLEPSSKAEID